MLIGACNPMLCPIHGGGAPTRPPSPPTHQLTTLLHTPTTTTTITPTPPPRYYGERAAASVQISIDDSAVGASHGYFLPACGDHVSNLGIQSPVRIAVNASTTLTLNYSQVLDDWFFDHNGTFPSRIMDACARVTGGPCGQC